MSTPQLHERLERIRITTLKEAYEAQVKRMEIGMNEMVQVAQQSASLVPVAVTEKENPE